jgi:hypothetical protein
MSFLRLLLVGRLLLRFLRRLPGNNRCSQQRWRHDYILKERDSETPCSCTQQIHRYQLVLPSTTRDGCTSTTTTTCQ